MVLRHCTHILQDGKCVPLTDTQCRRVNDMVELMSSLALRTLAVAQGIGCEESEEDLTFLGIVGMQDPARPEAAEAVEIFRHAGVSTVMITGDHVDTAYACFLSLLSCAACGRSSSSCGPNQTESPHIWDTASLRPVYEFRIFLPNPTVQVL